VLAGVLVVAGVASTALLPYLLVEHPLVLLALSSDGRNVVLTAGQVSLTTMLVVGGVRRAVGMLSTFWIGALYGQTFVRWVERKAPRFAPFFRFLERVFLRLGTPLLVVLPMYTVSALAGATRTPLRRFIVPMCLGQVGYVAVAYTLGGVLSEWTDQLVSFFREHLVESTLAFVAVVVLQQLFALRRRRQQARDDRRALEL
jgi:membrane protein DedA with SNARE-associated domain